MAAKINTNFRCYVVLAIFGMLLILFYIRYTASMDTEVPKISENMVLSNQNIALKYNRKPQYKHNMNSSHKHANKPIKQDLETSPNNICSPTYFILTTYHFEHHFHKHGFSKRIKKCKGIDLNELGITTRPVKRKDYPQCYIYNQSFENKPFCIGGKLIWKYRPLSEPLKLRLESKHSLYKILTQYCRKTFNYKHDSICSSYLLTYNMDIDEQRNEFLQKHIDCNIDKPQYDKTWVFKENTHSGAGIHMYNNHKLINQLLVASPDEQIDNCKFQPLTNKTWFVEEGFRKYYKLNDGYVVNRTGLLMQEFVDNPMLIDNHIFHIRSHFLIASYQNPFIVLHWPRPFIIVNPNNYNNTEIKLDKKKILTNRHVVLDHKSLGYEFTWGYTQLQEYLDRTYGFDLFGGNYTRNKMNDELRNIVKFVLVADQYDRELNGIEEYTMNYNEIYFDQYCMDVIMNDKFELKLMEWNTYCGIECEPRELKIKQRKFGGYDWECDQFRDEATQIIWEIFKKKANNQTIEMIEALNTYEIAFWKK